uniref:Uncharacterized protein n=1 Tax=Anopheles minimus TaxID=112268 RepID=A0A182WNP0_9DIPT
MHKVIDSISFD